MATAALLSPVGSAYHGHSSSTFPPSYHSPIPTSMPGMITPLELRKNPEAKEGCQRQSLPSISEVISGPPGPFPPVPVPVSPSSNLPSPFAPTATSRPFPDTAPEKQPLGRPSNPATPYARPEAGPSFPEPARTPHAPSRNTGPAHLPPYPGQHPQQQQARMEAEEMEASRRHPDARPMNGGYGHMHPQGAPPPYAPSRHLPPGQVPLPGYPASPRSPFNPVPSAYRDEFPVGYRNEETRFEPWMYTEALHTIATSSRDMYSFAEAYDAAAREQQGTEIMASRLPNEMEVDTMIDRCRVVLDRLERVRDAAVRNRIMTDRARESGNAGNRRSFEEEDVAMYSDNSKQGGFNMDSKKRRGRAAPPGRCHSCNRSDTPEWRRGPDGARTLCNACGLHYAKLERKRQTENRSMRSKPADERV